MDNWDKFKVIVFLYVAGMVKKKENFTHFALSSSDTNFSLSLKHCNEFIVDKTSGSKSSTVGIMEVYI